MPVTRQLRRDHKQRRPKQQRGAALLLILFIALTLGLAFLFKPVSDSLNHFTREGTSNDSMAQAKDALVGFAATYRDRNPNEAFGYLPCPDTNNDGFAEPNCGNQDESVIGRVPWKTLGIAPLRDSASECLWYAVSGHAKDNPKTSTFNWDTLGQFIVQDADGNTLAGATPHDRPFAVLLAPHNALNGQSRTAAGASECGGNNNSAEYLEGIGALGTGDTNIVVASASSLNNGTNNDRALWITGKDVFDRMKVRSDFKADVDTLLGDIVTCLNAVPVAGLPLATATNKGLDNIPNTCFGTSLRKSNFATNWKDNLLYAGGPTGNFTINGSPTSCKAILIFGGERFAGQSRATVAEKSNASNYLEGTNATIFPNNGAYTGATNFYASASSADIVRCITGLPPGATQVSFAQDLATFTKTGATATIAENTSENSVTIVDNSAGTAAGCYWSPIPIPLAGKTLRAYYEYQFAFTDTYATTGAPSDRGNGFTLQLVRGDITNASGTFTQPSTCGTEANLGALNTSDIWGSLSYIIETDVRRTISQADPLGNHTAVMINGSLNHSGSGGTPTTTCDGTSNGCMQTPANTFEDSPTPLVHNQRVEIHTGCNAACTQCNPADTGGYSKVSVWVDCSECNDVTSDLLDSELITPVANRDFRAAGDWSGTNWFVASNALNHTAGANAVSLPNTALTSAPTAGTAYRIDIVLNTGVAGGITVSFGGISQPLSPIAGTTNYRLQLNATSSAPLTLTPDASWVGSISQVSVKPVRPPKMNRCIPPYAEMNQVFFGLTGGFLSGVNTLQGVTIKNLLLRTD